jgi:8-oxo-dGTP pyrophosphatase MutT (NUDIX family)
LNSRIELVSSLLSYTSKFKEEELLVPKFLTLLESPRCYHRDHLPGHITGSAWIIDETKTNVLLIHHNNLHKWLQPGGHADGDENVLNVAVREANEETGLTNIKLLTSGVFDLDIHLIPERKGFPKHDHYDVRFLFEASVKDELKISEESSDLKWIKLDEVPVLTQNNPSILRMIQKLTTAK